MKLYDVSKLIRRPGRADIHFTGPAGQASEKQGVLNLIIQKKLGRIAVLMIIGILASGAADLWAIKVSPSEGEITLMGRGIFCPQR